MNKAIIFRDFMLARSETFIQAQADALTQFKPVYAGLRPATPSLPIRAGVLMTRATGARGKAAALGYRLTSFAPRFHRALKAENAALIHAHFAVDGAAALHMRNLLKVPLIVTLHGYDVTTEDAVFDESLAGRRYLAQRPALFAEASQFLCISQAIRQQAISRGFPQEKLTVHYTGVDTEFFLPEAGITREPIVLFVGRLVAKKGCEYAIRAIAEIQEELLEVQLVIIGDGPLRGQLEAQAAASLKNFLFLGAQGPEVVKQWMNRAKVFCTPSVTAESGDQEGLGMVFVEAQAMGLPVASFASGGIPEAVRDGKTGLLAPERDHHMLARHVQRFIKDEQFWTECSVRGRQHVSEKFDLRRQTERLEAIYRKVQATGTPWHCSRN
jgi:colanic acid/amylovoran biosynthesis glycosyltransferase